MKTPAKPAFKLTPAKSSNVEATGYDPVTQTLHIQFKGGKTYAYAGVPQDIGDAAHKAESIGKFINANIVGKFKHSLQG